MNTFKKTGSILGAIAFVFSLTLAFAFTQTSSSSIKSELDDEYVWIKYDCNAQGEVLLVESGTNYQEAATPTFTGNFADCPGSYNYCAVRFHVDEVDKSDPTNWIPTEEIGNRPYYLCTNPAE